MIIDFKNIDGDNYVTVPYRSMDYLDRLLFNSTCLFYNMKLKKYMYNTFNKCNIDKIDCYIYHVPYNKIVLLGSLIKQDESIPHSFSFERNNKIDWEQFYKENISFYENYYEQNNILFYFKLKNNKELAKFKICYVEQ